MSSQHNENKARMIADLSFIIGSKNFSDSEIGYISNRIDHNIEESINDQTKEQGNRRYTRFLRDMIMYFMSDNERHQEQLEKILHYLN